MAKRSRRDRKQEVEKQTQPVPVAPKPVAPVAAMPAERTVSQTALPAAVKSVDFGVEYAYVFNDLRAVSVFVVLMFVLMVTLGFFI